MAQPAPTARPQTPGIRGGGAMGHSSGFKRHGRLCASLGRALWHRNMRGRPSWQGTQAALAPTLPHRQLSICQLAAQHRQPPSRSGHLGQAHSAASSWLTAASRAGCRKEGGLLGGEHAAQRRQRALAQGGGHGGGSGRKLHGWGRCGAGCVGWIAMHAGTCSASPPTLRALLNTSCAVSKHAASVPAKLTCASCSQGVMC